MLFHRLTEAPRKRFVYDRWLNNRHMIRLESCRNGNGSVFVQFTVQNAFLIYQLTNQLFR